MQETPFRIKGKFLEDSVVIGQPVHYSLYVSHPKAQEVFFPNANQNFGAFETVKKIGRASCRERVSSPV